MQENNVDLKSILLADLEWKASEIALGFSWALGGLLIAVKSVILHGRILMAFVGLAGAGLLLYAISHIILFIPSLIFQKILMRLVSYSFGTSTTVVDSIFSTALAGIRHVIFILPLIGLLFFRYVWPQPFDELLRVATLELISSAPAQGLAPPPDELTDEQHHDAHEMLRPHMIDPESEQAKLLTQESAEQIDPMHAVWSVAYKLGLYLAVYIASWLPIIGFFVFPAVSVRGFYRKFGSYSGMLLAVILLFAPSSLSVSIASIDLGTKTIIREVLKPVFHRMKMTSQQKREFTEKYQFVLLGFALPFYFGCQYSFLSLPCFALAQAAVAFVVVRLPLIEKEHTVVAPRDLDAIQAE